MTLKSLDELASSQLRRISPNSVSFWMRSGVMRKTREGGITDLGLWLADKSLLTKDDWWWGRELGGNETCAVERQYLVL